MKFLFRKSVISLMIADFCSTIGTTCRIAVLSMFLRTYILLPDSVSRQVFHSQHLVGRALSPLFGVMADNYVGAYRLILISQWCMQLTPTIFVILAITPLIDPIKEHLKLLVILLLVYNSLVGYAGAPALLPFAADQFNLPAEKALLTRYFRWLFWITSMGYFIGVLMGPAIRQEIHCFGQNFCFLGPFVAYWFFNFVRAVTLTACKPWYNIKPPKKANKFFAILGMIPYAIGKKIKSKGEKKEHWADYASDKYDKALIDDVKELRVLYMILIATLVLIFSEQQMSTFIFQACRMNTEMGPFNIPPDSTPMIGVIIVLISMPIFDIYIFPALKKRKILEKLHLQLMFGCFMVTCSAVISAAIFLILESEDYVHPSPPAWHLHVYNPLDCQLIVNASFLENPLTLNGFTYDKIEFQDAINETAQLEFKCGAISGSTNLTAIEGGKCVGVLMQKSGRIVQFDADLSKNPDGHPAVFHIGDGVGDNKTVCQYVVPGQSDILGTNTIPCDDPSRIVILAGEYNFQVNDEIVITKKLYMGAVYGVFVHQSPNSSYTVVVEEITARNTLHIMWIIPQYVFISLSTVYMTPASIELLYTEAPESMKMFVQGFGDTVVFLAELLIVIFATVESKRNSINMFICTGLTLLAAILYLVVGRSYKYRTAQGNNEEQT